VDVLVAALVTRRGDERVSEVNQGDRWLRLLSGMRGSPQPSSGLLPSSSIMLHRSQIRVFDSRYPLHEKSDATQRRFFVFQIGWCLRKQTHDRRQ
jgi:hypothetical protein